MNNSLSSLLLVGCGKMGGALLERWKQNFPHTQFHVIEPNTQGVGNWYKDLNALPAEIIPEVVVLAVKPQQLDDVLPQYRERFASHPPLYLSIAAGKPLAYYQDYLGNASVVRVMPNTPALVGEGMSVLYSPNLAPDYTAIAASLMKAAGEILWIPDESVMDAVTAISGSGPAYFFLFVEALIEAGVAAGLSKEYAELLAAQTFYGSAALAKNLDRPDFAKLRENVTSKGGTTAAAIEIFTLNDELKTLVKDAVLAAKERSKELSS